MVDEGERARARVVSRLLSALLTPREHRENSSCPRAHMLMLPLKRAYRARSSVSSALEPRYSAS